MLKRLKKLAALICHRVVLISRRLSRPLGTERWLYHQRQRRLEPIAIRCRYDTDPNRLLDDIRNRNLVFTVTAGRSGSQFLQKMLEILPDTTSLHEPDPAFHRYMRRIQYDHDFASEFLLTFKLPAISRTPGRNYAELSHVFCKGYLEPLLGLGITPNLILLRRAPRRIALSYLEANTVPGRTALGFEYLLSPSDPGVLPLPGWQRMSDYQLLFWYALEIERRQLQYRALVTRYGGIVRETSAEDLHDRNNFFTLVEALGMLDAGHDRAALAERHAAVKGRTYNQNRFPMRYSRDLDAEEAVVWRAIRSEEPSLEAGLRTA